MKKLSDYWSVTKAKALSQTKKIQSKRKDDCRQPLKRWRADSSLKFLNRHRELPLPLVKRQRIDINIKWKTPAPSREARRILFSTLPLELIQEVFLNCTGASATTFTQICSTFRKCCSKLYLCQIGVLVLYPNRCQVVLDGNSLHPAVVHLLQLVELPRFIRLQCDVVHLFLHVTEIITFLSSASITSFDLLVLEDEWKLFQEPHCVTAFWSLIGSLPKSCHQIRLSERRSYLPNNRIIPPYSTLQALANSASGHTVPRFIDQIDDLTLSSRIANAVGLGTTRTVFFKRSQLTRLALDCSDQIDALNITAGLVFPALESLYIYLNSAELPFPIDIANSHLYSLRLTGSFPDSQSSFSFSSPSVTLTLPSVSHAALSSKFSTILITNLPKLRSLSLTAFITCPSPKIRGYCCVVESLTSALSDCSQQSNLSGIVVELVFPRRLSEHLSFCEENPVYRCSCSSTQRTSKLVKGLRFVEVCVEALSNKTVKYLCKWLEKFPALETATLCSDAHDIPESLPSIGYFHKTHFNLKNLCYKSRFS